jgi:hypothetical protein
MARSTAGSGGQAFALRASSGWKVGRAEVHRRPAGYPDPLDTLRDIHYMCTQSRRLRGASAEASYEVGRDAAPACAARNRVPGRPPGSLHGVLLAPRGSGRRTTRKRKRCRGGAPSGAGAPRKSARARRSGLARLKIGPVWSNPGHAPLRRAIPLMSGDGKRENGIRADPSARTKSGASIALASVMGPKESIP